MKKYFPVLFLFASFGTVDALAGEQASHRAVYDITLASTKGGAAGVVNAYGRMSYSAQKVCGRWNTESVFSLDVGYELSGNDTTIWKQTTKESDDGCFFEFDVFVREKGKDRKELSGKAVCEKGKKVLRLTEPLASRAEFPSSVLFPVAQTLRLLNAAEKGRKSFSSYVYDGTRPESLYSVNAMISVPPTVPSGAVSGDTALIAGKKTYRFDMAFFQSFGDKKSRDGTPSYEVSADYCENGIGRRIEQDFGAYRLKSELVSVERLEEIVCPEKK